MIDSNFRNPYQRLVIHPLLKWGIINRLSPQVLTLFGVLTGVMIPICLYFQKSHWALICLALSGFFDTLDGSLARHLGKTSPKGAVLDITSDRLVEFAIILGLYLHAPEGRALLSLGMLGAVFLCVTTFLVVGIFQVNSSEKSFHYSPGLIERGEAFLFFTLMILFPFFFAPLAILFISLTSLTAYIRIFQFINN
ncbi:MAG: CDP-alcohol phosphatidyltransferase family protein [Simkaniaceae bacterium]|nr:MAG: CDP-alcohol phosphatidyltransferase family protein [Simkaniaceae bacterium]